MRILFGFLFLTLPGLLVSITAHPDSFLDDIQQAREWVDDLSTRFSDSSRSEYERREILLKRLFIRDTLNQLSRRIAGDEVPIESRGIFSPEGTHSCGNADCPKGKLHVDKQNADWCRIGGKGGKEAGEKAANNPLLRIQQKSDGTWNCESTNCNSMTVAWSHQTPEEAEDCRKADCFHSSFNPPD